jgi:hypothetical protein
LGQANSNVARCIPIEPDAGAHGEGVMSECGLVEARVRIYYSEKGLSEGR